MDNENKYVSTCELMQKLVNAQVEINRAVFELNKYGSIIDDALEKQAPEKGKTEIDTGTPMYVCPICNKRMIGSAYSKCHYKYCAYCGQAIDWSEDD